MKFTKKLSKDELEMAVHLVYAHYGKYFCDNAEDLAKQISHDFDCNCTDNEVYIHVNVRTPEEEDTYFMYKNIMQ